jgi:hypothetical protein
MRTVAEARAESAMWGINHIAEHMNASVEQHGYYVFCLLPEDRQVDECKYCREGCVLGCGSRWWQFWRRWA